MIRLILVEWLKTKRTAIRWITFLLPILISGCIIGYTVVHGRYNYFEMNIFKTFFEALAIFIVPPGVSILTAQVVYEEELAGGFNMFLSEKFPRYKLYLSKFCILNIILITVVFLTTAMFFIGTAVFLPEILKISAFFIIGSVLTILGTLPIIAIHLWLSFSYGMGTSIGTGIIGLLTAAIIGGTELGNNIWQFIPWALPIRLVKAIGPYLEFSADMINPPVLISSGWTVGQFLTGIISAGTYLAIAIIGGIIWFNKWEGKRYYE